MARTRGRVIISKVDSSGTKIKNFKTWRALHPAEQVFDSKVEWSVWNYLNNSGIDHQSQTTLELFDQITTREFQQPRKTKHNPNGTREIKRCIQRKIAYTPDYYLPEFDTYIEVKGYADEVFKLRWKLFKLKGYKGFIVYSLDEFKQLYSQLKLENINDQSRNKV